MGKTALGVDVIQAFPERDWLALKITRHHDDRIGVAGYAFHAEADREGKSDTSRFLAAGAKRSFLIEIHTSHFREAICEIRMLIAGAETVLVEGNSVLGHLHPALAVLVLDPRRNDFKLSAREAMREIDAVVVRSPMPGANWAGIDLAEVGSKPRFLQPFGRPIRADLRKRIQGALTA
ncbi:MAG: hypothetical protein WA758_06980 [Candidatus Acidiferrales bacterium]